MGLHGRAGQATGCRGCGSTRRLSPAAGEVRVRTLYSGITAGTELAMYRGTNPYLAKVGCRGGAFLPGRPRWTIPSMSGAYSEVGKIDALGDGVTGLQLGEVVWGAWFHRSHAVLPAETLLGHVLPPGLDPMVGKTDTPGGEPT